DAHPQRAPCFTHRDLRPDDAGSILAPEGLQMSASVEHGDGERRTTGLAALLERRLDDRERLPEGEVGHVVSLMLPSRRFEPSSQNSVTVAYKEPSNTVVARCRPSRAWGPAGRGAHIKGAQH